MQLQFNYTHNYRHPSGNLHGDGQCHIWLRDQNHHGAIYGAVGILAAMEKIKVRV
jgi:hypothetical protein